MDAYWRAANHLSVVQVYLYDNPLLKKPLAPAHIRARLLGHWGTTSGLNFIYIHLNRIIKKYDLNVINITGPSHVAPETSGAIHEGGRVGLFAVACIWRGFPMTNWTRSFAAMVTRPISSRVMSP